MNPLQLSVTFLPYEKYWNYAVTVYCFHSLLRQKYSHLTLLFEMAGQPAWNSILALFLLGYCNFPYLSISSSINDPEPRKNILWPQYNISYSGWIVYAQVILWTWSIDPGIRFSLGRKVEEEQGGWLLTLLIFYFAMGARVCLLVGLICN